MSPAALARKEEGADELSAEDVLREFAHHMGKLEGQVGALKERVDSTTADILARLSEYDRNARESALHAKKDMETALNALRHDVVAANTNLLKRVDGDKAETDKTFREHRNDITTLQTERAERSGAFKLTMFLEKATPWIISGLMGLVAYLK